jgi:hypothetical protein
MVTELWFMVLGFIERKNKRGQIFIIDRQI